MVPESPFFPFILESTSILYYIIYKIQCYYYYYFLQHHMLYIELMSPAVEEWRSNHWTAWELLKEKKGGGCFPGGTSGKESTCQCKRSKRSRVPPWVGKIPWRRKWQSTPAFLPGKSHGQGARWATVRGVAKSQTRLSQQMNHRQGAALPVSCQSCLV